MLIISYYEVKAKQNVISYEKGYYRNENEKKKKFEELIHGEAKRKGHLNHVGRM